MTVQVLPIPQSPVVDKDGNLNPEWRRFLVALVAALRELQ